LVEREHRHGPDYWFATARGVQLGVTPYVTRLLGAARPKWTGWAGDWLIVGPLRKVGTTHGPPIFSPAWTLAEEHDPNKLGAVLRSGTEDDRAYALTKLIALNDPASIPILREVADRHGDEEPLARQAVIGLGHFDTPASREALIEIAANRDSIMREAAAHSLGQLAAREAVPTLLELIDFPSEPVRVAALRALGRIGDPSAAPSIADALNDPDGTVRYSARHTLIQLGATGPLERAPGRPLPLRKLDVRRARRHASVPAQDR
jgi:HEAT repeat protein